MGGCAVSTPFSLRAELKGVEVAPGVTLRYWEAGAGRVLVMLPGLGHAASLYKYQLEGLCDEFRVIALDPRGMASRTNQSAATTTTRWLRTSTDFSAHSTSTTRRSSATPVAARSF